MSTDNEMKHDNIHKPNNHFFVLNGYEVEAITGDLL